MWLTVLILSFLLVGPSQAGNNDGQCEIEKFTDSSWLVYLEIPGKVYDNENKKIVYESPYTGSLTDLKCTCTSSTCNSNYEYITITNDESSFLISTSDHMTDLDKDTAKTNNPSIKLVYSCEMKCNTDSPSILPVVIDVYDYNNHAPEFEVESYTYKVASPIMPMSDFTVFGNSIEVEDLDFSNTDITFSIDPNDFDIFTTVDNTNNKKYIPNIRANKAIVLTESVTYKLTATDSGTDPKSLSTTVDVTIDVNETLSWDVPSFEYSDKSMAGYVFEYVSSSDQLNPLTGPIKLNTNKPNSVEDIQLLGEMKDYFAVKYVSDTQTFELSSKTIENPTSTSTILTLSLKTDFEISTPIIIKFSEVSSDKVSFEEHSYTGSYEDVKNIITMDEEIVLTITSGTPTFEITGDFSDNFKVKYDENSKICTLSVEPALTPAQIQSKVYLTLTLQATVNDDADRTVIIIKLPTHTLEFTEILYTATYNDDNSVTMDAENPIAFTTDATDVTITVDESYSKYFKVNEKLAIDVEEPLPFDILTTEAEIAIVLTAEDVYSNKVKAVVRMVLPLQETIEAPKFSQPYYTVEYSGTEEYIDVDLAFDNIEDPSVVTIDLSEYSENFELVYKDRKWIIQILQQLDTKTFNNNNELIITMTATEKSSTGKGLGVLVVLLEKSDAPEFSQLSYLAKYTRGETGVVDFEEPVGFENVKDPNLITISLSAYADNFEVYYDKSTKKWRIKINKDLDSDIFDKTSELVIEMTATETGNSKTGAAVLVIELIDSSNEEAPKFSSISYIAQYTRGQTKDSDFTTELSFTNVEDNTKIEIELNSYADNFEVYYDKSTKKWRIKIKKAPDSDIFDTASELVIEMTATEAGNSKTGAAVLVIELIDSSNEEAPKFSSISYIAQYTRGQTKDSDFTTELSFTNVEDNTKIEIELNSYADNFEVYYDKSTKKWRIKINKDLDSDIFDKTSELVIEMTATEAGNSKTGAAVLVIELIDSSNEEAPKFSSISYIAQYTRGQTKDSDFTTELSFTNVEDNTKIEIDLNSYEENFKVYYDKSTKKWRIKIKKAPDSDIFDTASELVIEMTATEAGNSKTGAAVLVIELIDSSNEEAPKFSSISYIAQYTRGQTKDSDFTTELSFTNVEDNTKIEIDLNSYEENFKVYYDKSTKKWRIKIKKAPDSDIFDTASELVIEMTATEAGNSKTGAAVLVIELIDSSNEEAPKFSSISYIAQYTRGQTKDSDFTTELSFTNVEDNTKIEIDLNSYEENFKVYYDKSTKKWRIKIKKALDPDTFDTISELVIKMTATETGNSKTGAAVLVIELIDSSNEEAPKFSSNSYIAQYTRGQTKDSDFTTELSFTNVEDNTKIEIDLNSYEENFKVYYDTTTKKWRIKIKKAPDSDIFDTASELVIEMTATEAGNSKTGAAVLVIELIDSSNEEAPKFSSISYIAQYTRGQTKDSDFTTELSFTNVEDNTKIEIDLNSYADNFEVYYDKSTKKWRIKIKKAPDSDIFDTASELVIEMTATETGNSKTGAAVLVIELINPNNEDSLQYSDIFYVAQYAKISVTTYIDFDKSISFNSDEDMSKISIDIDDYTDNFEVVYTNQKWRLHVTKPLDNTVLDVKQDLILIMTATQTETSKTGKSVLIIELTEDSIDTKIPQFEDAYYTAVYPIDGNEPISFNKDIIFDNIDDINKVTITISDYAENFNVTYNTTSNKWFINIRKPLDEATLSSNTFLTSTLTAQIEGDDRHSPVAGFVLKLPVQEAPVFSKSYFAAQYTIEDDKAKVTFVDQIEFSNDVDVEKIDIVSDEYSEYLSFEYDTEKKQWGVTTNGILDTTSLDRLNLVVAITATDTATNLQGHSVIDLKLPKVNDEDSPKFSKTYYKANYDLSTGEADVILEDSIDFLNRNDMSTISITTNVYTENFNVTYTEESWKINVKKNLDQSILNNKVDIIMELIASDSTDSSSVGQATLLITLPVINNDDAPKFSSIFYESQCNSTTKILETIPTITINNKEDLSEINVGILENEYQSNFDIQYKSATKSWEISVISLPDDVEKLGKSLVLTLTASEPENTNIGQSALIINFPSLDAPEFSSNQYFGKYEIVEDTSSFTMDDVVITNKDNQNNIRLLLSSSDEDLSSNFKYSFDDEKKIWKITLDKAFDEDFISGKTELILTLTAIEDNNPNEGVATVVIYLPTAENDLAFSSIHYEGNYVENEEIVEMDEKIQLTTTKDLTSVLFYFEVLDNIDANDYFAIDETSTGYYDVRVSKKLPQSFLQHQQNLVVTLQATLGKSKSSTALVINLPIPGEENTIEFSKLLYQANYSSDGGLSVEEITIITNEDSGNLDVTISKDSPYESYFSVKLEDKTVTLTAAVIPNDILELITVIPLTLLAVSSGTSKTGSAIVNIDTKYHQGTLEFSSVVFNGKYDDNNDDKLTVDQINLITDVEDERISVTLDKAFASYFDVSYSSSKVSLTLSSNIPDEFLQNPTLTLVLTATILDTDINSQAVINLRIISDTQPDTDGFLKFDDILFTAQYWVQNGKGIFKQDGDIGLTTDRTKSEINIQISEASQLEEYFKISYENQKITVSLKDNIPDDDFRSRKLISLTMTASTTSLSTSAVLNVVLNNDGIDNGYIYFESVVYNGKYTVENNMATIDYDNDITVITDQDDSKILPTIEDPYNAYFNVVYLNKLIKIDLLTTSASTTLRSNKNLPVVVTVQIKDTSLYSSTVVNFVVVDTDNGDDDNGPIRFPSQVYNGVYDVDKNSFTRDVIKTITDHPDGDIEVIISNEYNYDEYFEVKYRINEVVIDLKKALPKNEVKNLGSIALAIRARLKNQQTVYGDSVLNIKIQEKSLDNEGSSNTKYIIAVSVLSVLLFLVIVGEIALYYFIFRKRKYEKMTEDDYISSRVKFDKSAMKRSSTDKTRSSAIEERRPTGYVFTNADGEDVKESNTDSLENTRKKSVAFDENVEKMQIQGVTDEDIEKALGETTEL